MMAIESDDCEDNPSANLDSTFQMCDSESSVTPLHDACKRGATLEEIKELLNENPEYVKTKDKEGALPLHLACKYGTSCSLSVIEALIQAHPDSAKVQDNKGLLPIHHACENELPFEVIEALIDSYSKSIKVKDNAGLLPLHHACMERHQKSDVIEALIDLYPESLGVKNKEGKTPFGWDYEIVCGGHFTEFINYLVRRRETGEHQPSRRLSLKSSGTNTDDSLEDDITDTLIHCKNFVPIDVLKIGFLDKHNLESKGFIRWLNDMLCRRTVVFIMVFEFYIHVTWIFTFVSASNIYFDETLDQSLGWRPIALIVFSGIFLLMELIQMRQFYLTSVFLNYWLDLWNWVDLLTCAMVTVSAVKFLNDDPINVDERIFMVTGCLQSFLLLSYLKKTIFPFSKFVSGLTKIIWAMIPFLVVSILTLYTFSFMYFIKEKGQQNRNQEESDNDEDPNANIEYILSKLLEEDPHATQISSFQTVVGGVAKGAVDTSSGLDYFFGIIVVIVLLNVVIAVVSEEWQDAVAEANASFWTYRLDLIIEKTRSWREGDLNQIEETQTQGWRKSAATWRKKIRDWDCGGKDLNEFFMNSKRNDVGLTMEDFIVKLALKHKKEGIRPCAFLVIKCLWFIVLGFFTFGIFWPMFIRKLIFTPTKPKDSSDVARESDISSAMSFLEEENPVQDYRNEVSDLKRMVKEQNILLEKLLKKTS